ncbi:hypothetical protein LI291_05800 [Intestinibacillus massiliensis]|nr:hypothetical protein [Intestinibacillus massiliensis]
MGLIRKYGLLAAVAAAPVVLFGFPQAAHWLRYFHVVCIVASTFVGRSFVGEGDVRGWAVQTGALLAHAACLVLEGTAFRGLMG